MPRLARPRHAAALLAAGLLINAPLVRVAHADISGCRSDPVVALSNGVTVDLSAVIADGAADVRGVAYTLHVPAGLRAVSVAPSGGPLGPKETIAVVADDAPATYDSATVVTTGTRGVAVSATTTLVAATGATLATGTARGRDRQTLRVHLVA